MLQTLTTIAATAVVSVIVIKTGRYIVSEITEFAATIKANLDEASGELVAKIEELTALLAQGRQLTAEELAALEGLVTQSRGLADVVPNEPVVTEEPPVVTEEPAPVEPVEEPAVEEPAVEEPSPFDEEQ